MWQIPSEKIAPSIQHLETVSVVLIFTYGQGAEGFASDRLHHHNHRHDNVTRVWRSDRNAHDRS